VFLLYAVPLPRVSNFGAIFSEDDSGYPQRDYYEKQERLQKQTTDFILGVESSDSRIKALEHLNNLIKESSLTIEVDRAEDGLISMFNTPGPGLEPSQIDQYKHLLSSYSDSKAKFEQYDARSKIEKILKEDPFNVPARMAIMNYVNQMRQIRSLKEMRQFPSAKDIVQRHSMGKRTEDEISEHLTTPAGMEAI